jgi:hypothetical protein
MKIENPKVLEAAYQDSLMVQYPYMTQEQFNSSLDILEASTGVRPSVTFEGFVDHTLLKEARLQQKKNSRWRFSYPGINRMRARYPAAG